MMASEFVRELQALIDQHGDRTLIFSADDEGNSYNQAYSPYAGAVDKDEEHSWKIDSAAQEEDLRGEYEEDLEEYGDYPDEVPPTFEEWVALNYARVFVA